MNNIESFSKNVKNEITSIDDFSKNQIYSILSSYIKANAYISFRDKKEYILLHSENAKTIKFIYKLLQDYFGISPTISYTKKQNLNKNQSYHLSILNDEILTHLKIDILDNKIDKIFSKNDEYISGYFIGSFLASGSVNSPRTSNYHFEFSFDNENYSKWFLHLLKKYSKVKFDGKIIKRRNKYIVYLKKSDQISDMLKILGATESCLYFEDKRVERDFYNNENRFSNLDTANEIKILRTANKDIELIKEIFKKYGPNYGTPKIQLLMKLRLNYSDASLNELAQLMSKELNQNISKSNVNHLFIALRKERKNLK